jgi:hypothetical protein
VDRKLTMCSSFGAIGEPGVVDRELNIVLLSGLWNSKSSGSEVDYVFFFRGYW